MKKYQDLQLLARRWFPLWKLDGYILREFLIKYSVLLLVFAILFVLNDVYHDISNFLEAKSPWTDVMRYLAYKLPGNIRFILPISMLLGCMWTMATFGKNMEITAMRASGVSLFRCSWSIFAVGIIVTGVNIYFNESLVPVTEREAARIFTVSTERRRHVVNLLTYRSNDRRRHWLFNTFVIGEAQRNVTVKTYWTPGLVAQLIGKPGSPGYNERLGAVLHTKASRLLKLPPSELAKAVGDELRDRKIDIYGDRAAYDVKTGLWRFSNGYFVSYDRNDESRFKASLGTSAIHAEIPYKELLFTKEEIPEKPDDILNAVKEKDDLPTVVIWRLVRDNPDMPERVRAIYLTVFFYRLAFPWACFLAVFLGIPLATKNERTGSLMAVITAVAIILVYIVVAQVFLVFGKGGVLNPVVAGLTPTIGFILCGAWRIIVDRP